MAIGPFTTITDKWKVGDDITWDGKKIWKEYLKMVGLANGPFGTKMGPEGAWVCIMMAKRMDNGRHGKMHGKWISLYSNGIKQEEGQYYLGYIDGKWDFWNTLGEIIEQGEYASGRPQGIHTGWYGNGKKKWMVSYLSGKRDGVYTSWYENGTAKMSGDYRAGDRVGIWNFWHSNGNIKEQVKYQ